MRKEKPELVIISQNLLGGGASFQKNILDNKPDDYFDVKTIYLNPQHGGFSKSIELDLQSKDSIFNFGLENPLKIAKRLRDLISDRPGAVVASLPQELECLFFFPKVNKTLYFICHDDGFEDLAQQFHNIIDVFIAHNYAVYESLRVRLPHRNKHIFFIPHGVAVQNRERAYNSNSPLRIAFLARHHILKGIYDLPIIDDILREKGIDVEWLVMGDGQEKTSFMQKVKHKENFSFAIPNTNTEVLERLSESDIYILPSRKDGSPVSLLESMSVGCVPLVSEFSHGVNLVVTEDVGYVVAVGDNDAFVGRIIQLHKNRFLLQKMGENAKLKIKQEYNIKVRAKQYFDLYKDFRKFKRWQAPDKIKVATKKLYYIVRYGNLMQSLKKLVFKFKEVSKRLIYENPNHRV